MITHIRKWLFQKRYVRQLEKEGWIYLLEAGLKREELEMMVNFYNNSIKETAEKKKKVEELIEKTKEINGDAYNKTREEIKILQTEIASAQERDKEFAKKGMKQKKIEIGQKQYMASQALANAQSCKKLKI